MRDLIKDYAPPGTLPGALTAPQGETGQVKIHLLEYRGEQVNTMGITDLAHLQQQLADGQPASAVTWVHVVGLGDVKILQGLQDLFKLHPLAMEDVTHLGQRPKAESYDAVTFVMLQHLAFIKNEVQTTQIALFVGKDFVLSLQPQGPDLLEPLRARIRTSRGRLRERDADYLAYAIIDMIVDAAFPVLEDFGERLDTLEREIIERPAPRIMHTIYRLRRQLLHLRRVLWPQREALSRLIHEEQGLLSDEVKVYLRDSSDHAVQAMDVVESYREMAASLLDVHISNTTNRLTDVMRVLTVIATVFMPLNFVVGVYGMNFDRSSPWNMPELGWRFGYVMVWGVMLVIVAAMLWYFRRKRWL
ncbi:MAG: magnesium/cobalt transporter CorA [Gammaproteobacteria bacterium]